MRDPTEKIVKKRCQCNCLKKISVGKYNTVLFHKGETGYSTTIGGILTIFVLSAIFIYGVIVFKSIFNKDVINLVKKEVNYNR